MARMGSFQGPAEAYGAPSNVILPPDNKYKLARFDAEVLKLHLNHHTRQEVQDQIDALVGLLQLSQGIF